MADSGWRDAFLAGKAPQGIAMDPESFDQPEFRVRTKTVISISGHFRRNPPPQMWGIHIGNSICPRRLALVGIRFHSHCVPVPAVLAAVRTPTIEVGQFNHLGSTLVFGRLGVSFSSSSDAKHSFTVRWRQLSAITEKTFGSNQSPVVALQLKGSMGGDSDKIMNFFPSGTTITRDAIQCSGCKPRIYAYALAMRQLRESAVRITAQQIVEALREQKDEVASRFEPGVYRGPARDSSGPGELMFGLVRRGDGVEGTVYGTDETPKSHFPRTILRAI